MTAQSQKPDSQGAEGDRQTIWQPRAEAAADSVAKYSKFVSAMKIGLPVAAGILLLLVVVLPQFREDDERFHIGMSLIKGSETDTLSMTNARYFGADDKGQPYSVTAEGVRQRTSDDKSIDLVTPKAQINLSNGTVLSAGASTGLYDRDNQKLDLSGQVTVLQQEGNQLHTSVAVIMLKDGTATGRAPVDAEGSFGTMHATGGFDLSERDRVVFFHGPGRLTLNPDVRASATPTPAAPEAKKVETKP